MATFLLQSRNKEFRTYIHLCIKRYIYIIYIFVSMCICIWASQVALVVKNLSAKKKKKELICQCRMHKICRVDPWVGKITWRRKWQPTSVFLPRLENPIDRGAWWATVHGVAESDMTKWLSTHTRVCVCMVVCYMCICIHMCIYSTYGLIPARLGSQVTWKKFRLGSEIDLKLHHEYVTSEKSLYWVCSVSTEIDNIHFNGYGWLRKIR